MPHLIQDYTPQVIAEKYANYMKDTVRVDLRFTNAQISALHAAVSKEAKVKLTSRDVLAGYLVSTLNKVYEETLNGLFILVDVSANSTSNRVYTKSQFCSTAALMVFRETNTVLHLVLLSETHISSGSGPTSHRSP